MDQDQLRDIIRRERVLEILQDFDQFFENRFTGKIEVNFSQGTIAAVNIHVFKKGRNN